VKENAFLYQSTKELRGVPFWGYLTWYGGDGYVANLGDNEAEATEMVEFLQNKSWIDERTRAIFAEVAVLNMNSGLFSQLVIVFEFPPIGGVFRWHREESVLLYRYTGFVGLLNLLVEIILMIFVIVVFVRELKRATKEGWDYFRQLISWTYIIVFFLFIIAVMFYVRRSILTSSTVEEMMNNRGQ